MRLSNGMLQVQAASVPAFYQTSAGWVPIDNTIRQLAPGWFGTTGNSWTASFGDASEGMILGSSTDAVSFMPMGASKTKPVLAHSNSSVTHGSSLSTSALVPASSVASWPNAWRDAGLRATVRTDGVSYDIELNRPQAAPTYSFQVTGASMQAAPDGAVGLTGDAGGGTFWVSPPKVKTAQGADVTAASGAAYSVSGTALVVTLNGDWLSSQASREFPITVDPDVCSGGVNPNTGAQCSPNGAESYPNSGSPVSGVQVGTSSGTTWRAGAYFNQYEAYIGTQYRVYDAQLEFPGFNCSCQAPASSSLKVWDQSPAPWPPSSGYNQIGQGVPLVEGPWNGAFVEVGADVDQWLAAHKTGQWFGVSADNQPETSYNPPSGVLLYTLDLFVPPQPSRVISMTDGQVLSTTTPTLQASQIPGNPENSFEYPMFDYQITTGAAPGTGLVIDSGEMCENNTSGTVYVCPNSGPNGLPPMTSPPNWTVPPGVLSEGVTYHAWVLTDWYGNSSKTPERVPPSSWGVPFTVKLGLGSGGPSPTDSVGSAPGQSSSASQGSPSPALPSSKLTVNMVNGNLSFSVATPKLGSVGGGLALGFTYNSLAATSQGLNEGLTGVYYNDPNGDDNSVDNISPSSDTQVGQRVDPNINFGWGTSAPLGAQSLSEAAIRWTGTIAFPYASTWALGDISSDGMSISYNNSNVLSDWGPHVAQTVPTFGPGISASTTPTQITIDWHHASNSPAVAQLYAEDLASSPPTPVLVPGTWLGHAPTTLPSGWSLNSNIGKATWVGLSDHGSSVAVYGSDGTGYEFINAGSGSYTAPSQAPNARLHVDANGNFILDDPDSGLIYTFNPSGALAAIRSASDDLHPAALQYCYSGNIGGNNPSNQCPPTTTGCPSSSMNISGQTVPTLLRTITDPVSGCQTDLIYGQDTTIVNGQTTEACPSAPSGFTQPASLQSGILCAIQFWNGTTTNLYYNSNGELAQVTDPGNVNWQFAYDPSGRLTQEMDPLSYQASQSGARTDCGTGGNCLTLVTYDNNGRAVTITSPAPQQGNARPERGYCYGDARASFSGATLNCSTPATNATSVAVAGLAPPAGYEEQVIYDARNRITTTLDSAGLPTTYVWDNHDRLVSTKTPAGIETSNSYDTQGRPVNSYGPAPSSSFNPDGSIISGQNVATSSTVYDGNMSGLSAAWYTNTNLSGTASYHALTPGIESWSSGGSPGGPIPSSGFSGHLTGLTTVPSPERLPFDGDGGQIQIDGHQYVNQMGGPYPGQVRSDNPSDWWRLGEKNPATVASDSAGTNNGTYSGGVTIGQSCALPAPAPGCPLADQDSTVATFSGSGQYVSLPQGFSWLANGFSIDAWIDPTATGSWQRIVEFGTGAGTNNVAFALGPSGYDLALGIWNNGSGQNFIVSHAVTLGTWQHVAVTFAPIGGTSTGNAVMYLNGVQIGTYSFTVVPAGVNYTQNAIGKSNWTGDAYFTGSISDVAVYPDLLSPTRVSGHYQAGPQTSTVTQGPIVYNTAYPQAIDADTPVSYWRLAEPSGSSTATDSNGTNSGTYSGGVTLGGSAPVVGDGSTSAAFNGTNGTVSVADAPTLEFSNTQPFTVEAWVNTSMTTGAEEVVSKMANAAPYQGWELGLSNGQPFFYLISTWSSNAILAVASQSIADGTWHHLALTYDGSSRGAGVTLYVDGAGVANTINNDNLSATSLSTAPLYIGSRAGNAYFFNGSIANVAMYNKALYGSEIQTHYQAGAFGPLPTAEQADSPVSMWRLNEPNPGVASGTSPAISVNSLSNGSKAVAYASSDGNTLWTGPSYGPTDLRLYPNTNPSVAVLNNGNVAVAFEATDCNLWTWTGAPGTIGSAVNAGYGMACGTSPSIAPMGGGTAAVAFHANTGVLWTWYGSPGSSGGSAVSTILGMWPGTSPSIAATSGYPAAVAFQAGGSGALWTWSGDPATQGVGTSAQLGMAPGTSPSIIAIGSYNQYAAVAFQANTGVLWTWTGLPNSTGYGQPTNMGMAPGASPSITTMSNTGGNTGTAAVSFQASYDALWTWTGAPTTAGSGAPTGLTATGNTVPIANFGNGQAQVAFAVNGTNSLWSWNGAPATAGSGSQVSGAGTGAAADVLGLNPGTYQGAVTSGQAGPANDPGPAASFDGVSGTVSIPDSPELEFSNTQPFSLEAWIKTSSTGSQRIMSKMANSSPYQGWEWGTVNGQPYLYLIASWETNDISVWANANIADGNWHHMAVTYDGSSKAVGVTFYIDGKPVSNTVQDDTLTQSTQSSAQMDIGSRADSAFFFNGSIADAAVYNDALSAGQVGLHYQAGHTAPGPGSYSTTHTITVDDQQFLPNGHLNIGPVGLALDPNYGLVTQTTDPDGKVTNTSYSDSAHGIGPQFELPTAVTQDPNGLALTTSTVYETPSSSTYLRVISKTLPAGNGSSYSYYGDTAGPLAAVCGASSNQGGALEQRTDPSPATGAGDAHEEQYVYDGTGRQVGIRTATVNTISSAGWQCNTYDSAGRISQQVYPALGNASARTVTYNYAVGGNPLNNSVTDTNWGSTTPISSTVDLLDRVISYSDIYVNTTASTFDQPGRLIANSGPQGNFTYCYNTAGQPSMTITSGTCAAPGTELSVENYDSSGRLNQVNTAGTSTGETIGYDTNGRQASESITTPALGYSGGGAQTYSPGGRVATQQLYANGSLNNSTNLTYDGASRLTQDVLPGVTYNYAYTSTTGCPQNNAGADTNRTSLTTTQGSTNTTTNYCYDNADRLVSTTNIPSGQVIYDAHGNITSEGSETLGYDSSNQLTTDDTPTYLEVYQRDPLGRPVQTTNYTKIIAGNATTASASSASTITVNNPTGAVAGDALVGAIASTAQSGLTTPTGWTVVNSTTNSGTTTWVVEHQAATGDPTSWTFNVNKRANSILASVVDYHKPTSTPLDVSAVANDASSTSQPLPTVTTTGYADTIVHVVGYNGAAVATVPNGDTQRANTSASKAALIMSDRYQEQLGASASVSASSTSSLASEAITVALKATNAATRLGYTGESDTSGFTQSTTGALIGTTVTLTGGITYNTAPSGASYSYSNLHGDVIEMTDSSNNRTWYGYWGPYGETPPGVTPPGDTTITGGTLGYNGAQGKLTEGGLILMGVRIYNVVDGRFLQLDPIEGGCANNYTYAFGDPVNYPDLSGEGGCHKHHHHWWDTVAQVAGYVAVGSGLVVLGLATGGAGDVAILAATGTALATGAVATGIDCGEDWRTAKCALDSASLLLGGAGAEADAAKLAKLGHTLDASSVVAGGAASLVPEQAKKCHH